MLFFLLLTFFRPDWADFDRDRLNTRDEILAAHSLVQVNSSCTKTCKITSGVWLDPYSEKIYIDPSKLDIDHVVPLKEAWRSRKWTREEFIRFANDPENLIPVNASDNRAKGDRGPDEWPPPHRWRDEAFWCASYIDHYLSIKKKWKMKIDAGELDAKERCL